MKRSDRTVVTAEATLFPQGSSADSKWWFGSLICIHMNYVRDFIMIRSIIEFISAVKDDLTKWEPRITPWFRGESGNDPPLCPKVARYSAEHENYLLQSFRRKAGGLANTPPREQTDMWLFLAQHYGVPTRLLDWTEGALLGLYFAINQKKPNARIYMLNPHKLNELATGQQSDYLNFPLSWLAGGYENVALAWEERKPQRGFVLPIAVPATYQDYRMISQRSCFTIHGKALKPLPDLLRNKGVELAECLIEYRVDIDAATQLVEDLATLGISGSTIFPDLDHLAKDISSELGNP